MNPILNTDSYKPSHYLQLPPGTENISSYIEARATKAGKYKVVIPFGLQAGMLSYLKCRITRGDIEDASVFLAEHGEPFNREGWEYILNTYGGRLPLRIKAVPEGLPVPIGSPLVTVEATDEKCAWLVSYVETILLRAVWYGTTVATQSWHLKQLIRSYLEKTGDPAGLMFKLHDFGARGVSSYESAGIGGAAHLVNFMGTDTISGILFAKRYYKAEGMPGFSIPAAEHSTITAWGPFSEKEAYENMVDKFGGDGRTYAVVSDSYDILNACSNIWGGSLREKVIAKGGTLVIRPDSGDPATTVLTCLRLLDEKFGHTVNAKGYKVLNHVRIIQGDGINPASLQQILDFATGPGAMYSADNVAFGMGGMLLQGVNRDTLSFAMKASAIKINGTWQDINKSPVGDAEKKSKRGRQTLLRIGENIVPGTVSPEGYVWTDGNTKELMETVYLDGEVVKIHTFEEIRAISESLPPSKRSSCSSLA